MTIDLQQCRDNFGQRTVARQRKHERLRCQARKAIMPAILAVVPQYSGISQVYLFGSITQPGRFHARSDIDIAVVGTDAATYFALWRDLETACSDWPLDLREINHPNHFADTVRQTGELVYESSSSSPES